MRNFSFRPNHLPATVKPETAYLISFNKAVSNFELVLNEERVSKNPAHGKWAVKRRLS